MVVHGFTTREGGVSEGIFSSMNLSFTRGDDPARVKENYRRAAAALGVPAEHIVCSDQTHTTNVRHVTMDDRGKGVFREKDYRDVDGLITDTPGLVLATFFADCVPLFFVDPVRRCIGLSHSGWKGTAARMGARTVEAMPETFGSNPADIRAAIGPSICEMCIRDRVITTQVPLEGSDLSVYEVGRLFRKDERVLEAYNMTLEAIVTKLMWLLACTKNRQELARRFYEEINYDICL